MRWGALLGLGLLVGSPFAAAFEWWDQPPTQAEATFPAGGWAKLHATLGAGRPGLSSSFAGAGASVVGLEARDPEGVTVLAAEGVFAQSANGVHAHEAPLTITGQRILGGLEEGMLGARVVPGCTLAFSQARGSDGRVAFAIWANGSCPELSDLDLLVYVAGADIRDVRVGRLETMPRRLGRLAAVWTRSSCGSSTSLRRPMWGLVSALLPFHPWTVSSRTLLRATSMDRSRAWNAAAPRPWMVRPVRACSMVRRCGLGRARSRSMGTRTTPRPCSWPASIFRPGRGDQAGRRTGFSSIRLQMLLSRSR